MLIWAIKHKKYDLIMQLYIKGAQGRIVDDEGNNLLHLAVKVGSAFPLQFLTINIQLDRR